MLKVWYNMHNSATAQRQLSVAWPNLKERLDMAILPSSSGIYKITCLPTGKVYIGSSRNIQQRWNEHRSQLVRGIHPNSYLQNAWNKYGEQSFVCDTVEVIDRVQLADREQYWIDHYSACNRQRGFNIAQDTRAPMLGRKATPEQRAKYAQLRRGRRHSNETKEKIRAWNVGRVMSPDARDKMHDAWERRRAELTPEQWRKRTAGVFHTPESRARMAASKRMRWVVTEPNGNEQIVDNLRQFCEERGLDYGNMKRLVRYPNRTCKGYRCRHV
jgi:group I intron endonuclease